VAALVAVLVVVAVAALPLLPPPQATSKLVAASAHAARAARVKPDERIWKKAMDNSWIKHAPTWMACKELSVYGNISHI
jgi:hypothetical protein